MATGCYTAPYLPASYGGVPFDAIEVTSEHGRRGAEGEFPFGENTGYADLGRRIRRYTIQGKFATNDHVARSRALIAIVEAPGPKILVHPTRGPVSAACKSCKVTDRVENEQGVTYLDMEFVEGNEWLNGFSFGLGVGGVNISGLVDAVNASFLTNYAPSRAPNWQRSYIYNTAAQGIIDVRNAYASAAASSLDTQAAYSIRDLDVAAVDTRTLSVAQPTFDALSLGMAGASSFLSGRDKYNAFRDLANQSAMYSDARGVVGTSQNAVHATIRIISAAYMTRGATEVSDPTITEALANYDQLSALLQSELDAARVACDNNLFIALREFFTETQRLLLDRAYNLPALIIYDFNGSLHALQAAYAIYGDAKQFTAVETNNPTSLPWVIGPEVLAPRT